ncbi:MAG: glyoxalase/bleomycin resistance/extradiol dioxygenase family protein [Gammaproteobacteria bacterium]|nr:MAG: glyoxalase/bleomycin resistance/extradiol dioxygenase family protein [Gammaproteobacteria bacterium]
MAQQIFVNLSVKDLNKSKTFFEALGYSFNPQFTNDDAACMVISDTIYTMLLTEPFFKKFTKKDVVDAKKATEVMVCLSADSRTEVDEIVRKAVAAGGRIYKEPQDQGFMYAHSFEDLDGHQWEFAYMDPSYIQ